MIEPMTYEEAAEILSEVVARARRTNPPELYRPTRVVPPIDKARLLALACGPIYVGFEEDVKRMRRGLDPLGPRE